jgi:hypothetical protein
VNRSRPTIAALLLFGSAGSILTNCSRTNSTPAALPVAPKAVRVETKVPTKELARILPSLCAIQRDLALRHIANAGTRFSNETHEDLHALLTALETKNSVLLTPFAKAKSDFEAQAFAYRVTMIDDLPALIATTQTALREVAPSISIAPCTEQEFNPS